MVAPRGLLVLENSAMPSLGTSSVYGCMKTARKVYESLGIKERMGVTQVAHADHCSFAGQQYPELNAFVNKFLRDRKEEQTDFVKTDAPNDAGLGCGRLYFFKATMLLNKFHLAHLAQLLYGTLATRTCHFIPSSIDHFPIQSYLKIKRSLQKKPPTLSFEARARARSSRRRSTQWPTSDVTHDAFAMSQTKGKILVILSDADSFQVEKPDGTISEEETGFFMTELATPLQSILDAGYDVEFASPNGHKPNIDPLSKSLPVAYMGNYFTKKKDEAMIERMRVEKNLYAPKPFREISDAELNSFSGIFIPGGHAPLTDLGADPELGRILMHFHERQKPTAVVCHGPYALLSTKVAPNSSGFAYKGYKITSWSDAEEGLIEKLKGGHIEKVESALREAGADMQTGVAKKMGGITVDREVVSGANPFAVKSLGSQFVEMLEKRVQKN
ncbi:hypothetical protein NMY22_g9532 [Coprinellus aureogranulatus]|nr:hypothetical protein NMY22_g9532 [Coprinellus aureogranulatus]